MSGNVAYGQSDVMNDRNYLYALLQRSNPHDPLKLMAQQRLEDMNRRDAMNQQAQEFGYRQQAIDEARKSREAGVSEAEAGRNERAGVRADLLKQAQADRKTQGLVAAMTALQYDQTPEGKKALANVRAEYLKDIGVADVGATAATATQPKATVGEYGPGGAQVKTPTGNAVAAPVASTTQPGAAYDAGAFTPNQPTFGPAQPVYSEVDKNTGLVTHHLASGGIARGYDTSTEKGVAAINEARAEGARRAGYLQDNTPAIARSDASYAGAPTVPAGVPASTDYARATQTPATFAANVPTNEKVQPNPVPFSLPNVATSALSATVPPELAVAQPSGAPSPAPGAPQPSVFGSPTFNVGVAPAPTPALPSPNPTPPPTLTPAQLAALKLQPPQY